MWSDEGMYLEGRPAIALARYVEKLWICCGYLAPHRRERVLPNGRVQIVMELAHPAPPVVLGIQTGCSVLETARLQSVMGAVFRPGGARPDRKSVV